MICVHNFSHEKVLVKVGVMEFGLKVILYFVQSYADNNVINYYH